MRVWRLVHPRMSLQVHSHDHCCAHKSLPRCPEGVGGGGVTPRQVTRDLLSISSWTGDPGDQRHWMIWSTGGHKHNLAGTDT